LSNSGIIAVDQNGNGTADAGDEIEYTLVVSNTGIGRARGVGLFDRFDSTYVQSTSVNPVEILTSTITSSRSSLQWELKSRYATNDEIRFDIGEILPNDSVIIKFRARVVVVNPNSLSIANTADLFNNCSTNGCSPYLTSASSAITLTPQIDLAVYQYAGSSSLDYADFAIHYSNHGFANASNVVITEKLPEYTTFDAANSASGWSCSGDICTYTIDQLGGKMLDLSTSFRLAFLPNVPADVDTITNVVTISGDGPNGGDINLENNVYTLTRRIGTPANISATKSVEFVYDANGNAQLDPADVVKYTIELKNTGNRVGKAIRVIDSLNYMNIVPGSASTTKGTIQQAYYNDLSVNVGRLELNETVTIVFRANLLNEPSLEVQEIINSALVHDSYGINTRTNEVSVPVYHAIRVSAVKSSSKPNGSAVYIGETLRYDIVVKNTGAQNLSNVTIEDDVSSCLNFLTNTLTTTKGTVSFGGLFGVVVSADIGDLSIDEEVAVSYEVIPSGGNNSYCFDREVINIASVWIDKGLYSGTRIANTNVVTHTVKPASTIFVAVEDELSQPLFGWQVFVTNLDNNESSYQWTTSHDTGKFGALFKLSAGSYKICEVLQTGWTNVYPGDVCYWFTLSRGDNVSLTFRNAPTTATSTPMPPTATPAPTNASLRVNVQTSAFAPLSDWTVTTENLSNGDTASQATDINGEALFSLPAGSYKICETLQSGWTNDYPGDTCYWMTLNTVDNVSLTFRNAASTATSTPMPPTATPAPTNASLKINVQTTDYVPLSGWTVTTENLSNGDTASQATDINGVASFSLPAGSYKICETLQSGWTNDYPGDTCYWMTLNTGDNVSLTFRNAASTATSTPMPPTATPAPTNAALKIYVQTTDYAPLSGWTVTAENLSNGDTASQATDINGVASFNLPAGSYKICETLQTGWENVYPGDTCYWMTLAAGDDLSLYFRNAQ
jgi:uncharacterized repeat protein (TIGR01451 family)